MYPLFMTKLNSVPFKYVSWQIATMKLIINLNFTLLCLSTRGEFIIQ